MSKKEVRAESAEPYSETASSNPRGQNDLAAYSEKTSLGGAIFKIGTYGPMPCRLQLSSKILERSGLKANDKVELIAVGDGQILIKKIGEPSPGLQFKSSNGLTKALDGLMQFTKEKEAELKEARERLYAYRAEAEEEEPDELSDEQRRQEEL